MIAHALVVLVLLGQDPMPDATAEIARMADARANVAGEPADAAMVRDAAVADADLADEKNGKDFLRWRSDNHRCRRLIAARHNIISAQLVAEDDRRLAEGLLELLEIERSICADATLRPVVPSN